MPIFGSMTDTNGDTMTDITRDLIQRLADALHDAADDVEGWGNYASSYFQEKHDLSGNVAKIHAQADEARAYLAQPEPEGPTDEEIMQLMPQQMHEDLAAAARALAEQASTISPRATGIMRIMLNRHAVDLARTVLDRWGSQPSTVAQSGARWYDSTAPTGEP